MALFSVGSFNWSKILTGQVFWLFAILAERSILAEGLYPPVHAGESVDYAMQIVEHFVSTFLPGGELFVFILLMHY